MQKCNEVPSYARALPLDDNHRAYREYKPFYMKRSGASH